MSVDDADDLEDEGRQLVIVALIGTSLHIRIFDASGDKVVDKAENELVGGETLEALKQRLTPLPEESSLSQRIKREIIANATSIAGHNHREYSQEEIPDAIDDALTIRFARSRTQTSSGNGHNRIGRVSGNG